MTEYDYSPEAYERYMATQSRISNWIDSVSQSMQMPSPSPYHPHTSDFHQQYRSRPIYPQPQPQPQPSHSHSHSHTYSHSRSNSVSRGHHHYHQEPTRPRSYSHTSSRPPPPRSYTTPIPQPVHSRTYSYALNQHPPPAPIPVPQPIPYPHLAPRRSRTLPPQSQNVYYHTYDAPRGAPTYVIVPPVAGGGPQQLRMQSPQVTPTKRSQPLLKRLFTSFGPWGSSFSGASPKSKHAPARRQRRRSSF